MRGEDASGDAEAEHEGVLCGGDVEETVILDAEAIVFSGRLVFVRILEELLPDVEWVLLAFPALFLAEVFDGSVKPEVFSVGYGLIKDITGGVIGNEAAGGVSHERSWEALGDAREETLKVLLLLGGELCRID